MYRLLNKNDFNKGFLELLKQLTEVGKINKKEFYNKIKKIALNKHHKVYVLEQNNRIVSCATLLIEPKFVHNLGYVGHIEDVVVAHTHRGQQLGIKIIDFLTHKAENSGCYKIILDCSDKNVGFYEKCLYERKGAYMARYLDPVIHQPLSCVFALRSRILIVWNFMKLHNKKIIIFIIVLLLFRYYRVRATHSRLNKNCGEE